MHILGQVIGPSFAARFCIVPELVYQGQLYRLVTHSIVHGSWIHLGLNMVSLLPLGPKLEENLGTLPFLALQLHAAFLGGIVYILLTFVVGAPRYGMPFVCLPLFSRAAPAMHPSPPFLAICTHWFPSAPSPFQYGLVSLD
jgi:membrane associated rhomboid family serine protease